MNTSPLAVYTGHIFCFYLNSISRFIASSHALVHGKGLVLKNWIRSCFGSSLKFSHSCSYLFLYCLGKGFMNDGQS